jgi:predicted RNA-binding Zn-ribbon protein involved in translation (DUF1610 family)
MDTKVNLNVKCTKCGKSLMDHKHLILGKPSILLNIKFDDVSGQIRLCSNYGCYEHNSTVKIPEDKIVEFYCPSCDTLLNTDIKCKTCDAPIVKFNIEIGGIVSLCSRMGCQNHYVMFENLHDAIRKFHDEYGM